MTTPPCHDRMDRTATLGIKAVGIMIGCCILVVFGMIVLGVAVTFIVRS